MSTPPTEVLARLRAHRLFPVGVGVVAVLVGFLHGARAAGRLVYVSTVRKLQAELGDSPDHHVADLDGSRIATALSVDLVLAAVCVAVAVLAARAVGGGPRRLLVPGLLVVLVVGALGLADVTQLSSAPH